MTIDLRRRDPYWSSVKLLLHFDGADASTTFTDSSLSARTVTPAVNAQIDTAQSVFGGASGLFAGGGDLLSIASHADMAPASGDFTVEWRGRLTTLSGVRPIYRQVVTGGLSIITNGSNMEIGASGVANRIIVAYGSTNTWYAWALARTGSTLRLYRDGAIHGTPYSGGTDNFATGITEIMNGGIGHMDELRWTKGIDRYNGAYTIAGKAFEP